MFITLDFTIVIVMNLRILVVPTWKIKLPKFFL